VLDRLELRLGWQPQRTLSLHQRVLKLGEVMAKNYLSTHE